MRFTVHTDIDATLASAIADRVDRAELVLTEQVKKDTAPFVPMRAGSLNTRTRTVPYEHLSDATEVVGNTIIYPGPYARFLYYGKVMIYPPTGSTFAPLGESKVVTDRDLVFTTDAHKQAQAFWFEASKAQNKDKWLRVAQKAVDKYGR